MPCGGPGIGSGVDPRYHVPADEIPRLHYPTEIDAERFEREFAAASRPCIIHGLLEDWPAHADPQRSWRGDRWDRLVSGTMVDVSFDPSDNRIMHFGDDEGKPECMFNPGRLRLPVWAFLEVARIRQEILEARRGAAAAAAAGEEEVRLHDHPGLRERLDRGLTVQNVPFIAVAEDFPLHHFAPISCRIRDLVPFAFYVSADTYAFPRALQEDVAPLAAKLMPGWGSPNSSRVWASSGGNWRAPFPPWDGDLVPEPPPGGGDQQSIYSCFHCDRMENFHSLLAGEKEVVLVPPGQRCDVLKATRFALQRQWLLAPVPALRGGGGGQGCYLGATSMSSASVMEFQSDQSAVHPLPGRLGKDQGANRRATGGAWPDEVDFPVSVGRLRKGDTLYIPAYHWHWVATTTPPALGIAGDGALAMSVNFWWWPIHNDAAMEEWSYQVETRSFKNCRVRSLDPDPPPERASHALSFRQLTSSMRAEAAQPKPWPCPPPPGEFEVVD